MVISCLKEDGWLWISLITFKNSMWTHVIVVVGISIKNCTLPIKLWKFLEHRINLFLVVYPLSNKHFCRAGVALVTGKFPASGNFFYGNFLDHRKFMCFYMDRKCEANKLVTFPVNKFSSINCFVSCLWLWAILENDSHKILEV